MFLDSASSRPIVCSAAETTVDSGAFTTRMPAPCRLVDVDVVDADSGPSDHAQARRALEQLGVELRLRADDDRVVVAR